jgi:hypothetical protein
MNPERTHAYRRVILTLNELGPSKLLDSEQDRIRFAADNLIFCSDLADDIGTRWAVDDVDRLCHSLVESGRWEQVTADRLANDVYACGPSQPAELKAA